MSRIELCVLLSDGREMRLCQRVYESPDEFRGRALCEIENAQGAKPGRALPKGTRWAEWENRGHNLGKWWTHGQGEIVEHTGNMYENRTRVLPGCWDETHARGILGLN